MIVEEEFVLKESTAICYYLLNKYAPYSDLYPKDLRRRARVDEILATVSIRIQPKISEFYVVCLRNKRKPSAEQLQELEDGVIVPLQRLVENGKFALGNSPTLADLCIAAHIAGVVPCTFYSREKFPKLTAYYDLISVELPYFKEICQPGIDARNKMWLLTQ
ncbi:glutathione S-transferase 1-like [Haemaphysalis longicornis]